MAYGEDYSPGLTLTTLPPSARAQRPLEYMPMAGLDGDREDLAPRKKKPRKRVAAAGEVNDSFLERQQVRELSKLMGAKTPADTHKQLKRLLNIDARLDKGIK